MHESNLLRYTTCFMRKHYSCVKALMNSLQVSDTSPLLSVLVVMYESEKVPNSIAVSMFEKVYGLALLREYTCGNMI